MIPKIIIGYPNISFLEYACKEYAGIPLDKLKESFKVLALIKSPMEEDVEFITCGQLLFADIRLLSTNNPNLYKKYEKIYKDLNEIYGNEFIDIVLTRNTDSIMESIVNALIFAMNTVYKTDEITVTFIDSNKSDVFQSEYPNLIYSAIQQHFIIKEQKFHLAGRILTIKKRSNNNDNAN